MSRVMRCWSQSLETLYQDMHFTWDKSSSSFATVSKVCEVSSKIRGANTTRTSWIWEEEFLIMIVQVCLCCMVNVIMVFSSSAANCHCLFFPSHACAYQIFAGLFVWCFLWGCKTSVDSHTFGDERPGSECQKSFVTDRKPYKCRRSHRKSARIIS